MTNLIKNNCPYCKNPDADIHAAVILTDDKGNQTSWNKYSCTRCRKGYVTERTAKEQVLVQKFVDASKIKLKK